MQQCTYTSCDVAFWEITKKRNKYDCYTTINNSFRTYLLAWLRVLSCCTALNINNSITAFLTLSFLTQFCIHHISVRRSMYVHAYKLLISIPNGFVCLHACPYFSWLSWLIYDDMASLPSELLLSQFSFFLARSLAHLSASQFRIKTPLIRCSCVLDIAARCCLLV